MCRPRTAVAPLRCRLAAVLVALLATAGCRDNTGVDGARNVYQVSLRVTGRSLVLGDTQRVTLEIQDSALREIPLAELRGRVRFVTSDSTRATVSGDGLVAARALGAVEIGVMVDTLVRTREEFLVIIPPRRVTVIATGDGDADLAWQSTCLGTDRHRLPLPCAGADLPRCRVRAGRTVEPCSWDLTNDIRHILVGVRVIPDSSVTVTQVQQDGSVIPRRNYDGTGSLECLQGQCIIPQAALLRPDTIRLVVSRR
ncbi:MAG: Ig-like domain-containing protein [Gemmatimonadaceae bacterium]|nr:Ig-like domain-containing protein [Gemmatimonadaceae bacterium]